MTPRLWLYVGGLVVVTIAIIAVLSFLSDPFGIRSWFEDRERDRQEQIAANGRANELEAEGQAEQIQRIETVHTQEVIVRDFTRDAIGDLRSAPHADEPLPSGDRLRALDERMCAVRPGVCATTDAADRGDAALHAGDPA